MLIDYLCFTQPFRRILVKVCMHLKGKTHDKLLNRLYPDDVIVNFIDEELEG